MPKDTIEKIADKIKVEMDKNVKVVADKIKPVMHAGDAESIPKSEWYQMIRDNWADPVWRQRQGIQRDPVKFVQEALEAHGLTPAYLNQNKSVLKLGLSQWVLDGTERYNEYMQQFGGPKPAEPIPQTPQSPPVEAMPPAPPQPIPVMPVQPQLPMDPMQQAMQEQQPIPPQQPLQPPQPPMQIGPPNG